MPPPARDREEQTLKEIEPLDASAVFALLHPDGPGYAVVDGVLGQEAARRAARAAARPRHEHELKRARVGRGDARRLSDERTDERPRFWMRGASTPMYKYWTPRCGGCGPRCVEAAPGTKRPPRSLGRNNNLDAARPLPTGRALPTPRGRRPSRTTTRGSAKRARHALLLTRNRRITAVYYLNENWNREDGGALRIYADTWTPDAQAFDVLPRLDRLVLFRSTLQHEVLVTRRERLALTQWWYGRIDDDNERVPWRLPAPGRAPQ